MTFHRQAVAANDTQQLTLTDSTLNLTQREKRVLEKSWAKTFAEKVFPVIDENIFSVLYSDKASRPNTPVNVIVGALIRFLKTRVRKEVSWKAVGRAKQLQYMKTEEFSRYAHFRNGVEAIPSLLRRRYHVDKIPAHGKNRTRFHFGFKIAALDFQKLLDYINNFDSCVPQIEVG